MKLICLFHWIFLSILVLNILSSTCDVMKRQMLYIPWLKIKQRKVLFLHVPGFGIIIRASSLSFSALVFMMKMSFSYQKPLSLINVNSIYFYICDILHEPFFLVHAFMLPHCQRHFGRPQYLWIFSWILICILVLCNNSFSFLFFSKKIEHQLE